MQDHFEAGQAKVAQRASFKDAIILAQLIDCDVVVENYGPKEGRVIGVFLSVPLCFFSIGCFIGCTITNSK